MEFLFDAAGFVAVAGVVLVQQLEQHFTLATGLGVVVVGMIAATEFCPSLFGKGQ